MCIYILLKMCIYIFAEKIQSLCQILRAIVVHIKVKTLF